MILAVVRKRRCCSAPNAPTSSSSIIIVERFLGHLFVCPTIPACSPALFFSAARFGNRARVTLNPRGGTDLAGSRLGPARGGPFHGSPSWLLGTVISLAYFASNTKRIQPVEDPTSKKGGTMMYRECHLEGRIDRWRSVKVERFGSIAEFFPYFPGKFLHGQFLTLYKVFVISCIECMLHKVFVLLCTRCWYFFLAEK